jgi:fused signal recognition particle receptor
VEPTVLLLAAAAGVAALGGGGVWYWRRRSRVPPAAGRPSPAQAASGLAAAARRLAGQLESVFAGTPGGDAVWTELEEALVGADVGLGTTTALLNQVRARVDRGASSGAIRAALRTEIAALLAGPPAVEPRGKPWIVLVTGVNGVGKTTTIGKLAARHRAAGRRVLLVAGDTFRAAAGDQLAVWAERTGAQIVRHAPDAQPSAVVFDGVKAALARDVDVVLIDTAGRLHTRAPLMEELRKVRRVIAREVPGAPHEVLLVLDATTGQNAVSQARTFTEAVEVTGVIVTKLDGTARGGVLLAVRHELGLPIQYVGVGERVEDLRPFDAEEFTAALFEEPEPLTPGDTRH